MTELRVDRDWNDSQSSILSPQLNFSAAAATDPGCCIQKVVTVEAMADTCSPMETGELERTI
jgi:hypothetical protein